MCLSGQANESTNPALSVDGQAVLGRTEQQLSRVGKSATDDGRARGREGGRRRREWETRTRKRKGQATRNRLGWHAHNAVAAEPEASMNRHPNKRGARPRGEVGETARERKRRNEDGRETEEREKEEDRRGW